MTQNQTPRSARRGYGSLLGRSFGILLILVVLGCAAWTWLTLSWAYAEGERAGVLQKFVRRGWLCKTQEGEIALYYGGGQYMGAGSSPQLWDFSARDPAVAAELSKAVGHRVQLHYTEHPGIPTPCFAETKYFVDRVSITDNEKVVPGGAAPGVATPGVATPGVATPGVATPGVATPGSASAPADTAPALPAPTPPPAP